MAQANLAVPSLVYSPGFPQAVDVVVSGLDRIVLNLAAKRELGSCEFVDRAHFGGTGEDDVEFPCFANAAVHDLSSDQQFCLKHFCEVNRG
jgi:hypothetical protein